MIKNEIKQDFTNKELAVLEEEFDFSLSGNEKVDYARCLLAFHTSQAQVWITNVKEPKEFVKKSLHIHYRDLKNSMVQPYSKSENGRDFYDITEDSKYDERDEISENDLRKGKTYVKGLKYEKGMADYVVQIYKMPAEKTYTVTIYKQSNFKSRAIWDIF